MVKRSFDMSNLQLALPSKEGSSAQQRPCVTVARKHVFAAPDLLPEQRSKTHQPFLAMTAQTTTAKRACILKAAPTRQLPPISKAFYQLLMQSTPQELALYQTHRFVPELDLWLRLPHKLHQYQLDVIAWMQKRSDGGLLCLAMGLGKTVIASAYMLRGTGPVPSDIAVARAEAPPLQSSVSATDDLLPDAGFAVACLVLVPSPLVSTWLSEVLKFFGKRIRITAHNTKDQDRKSVV